MNISVMTSLLFYILLYHTSSILFNLMFHILIYIIITFCRFGRGQYSSTRAVVHHSELVKWHKLRYVKSTIHRHAHVVPTHSPHLPHSPPVNSPRSSPCSAHLHLTYSPCRMISFDAPSYDMQKNLFEARYRFILQHCSPENPFNVSLLLLF